MMIDRFWAVLLIMLSVAMPAAAGNLEVLVPGAGGVVVGEAQDYATVELGDPWDMSNPEDVVLTESIQLTGEGFGSGVYSATSTGNDPAFFALFSGIPSSVVNRNRGQLFPIDTSVYRYVTLRVRYLQPAPEPATPHCVQVFFYDELSAGGSTFGAANRQCRNQDGELMRGTDWNVVTVDLLADSPSGDIGSQPWSAFADAKGLRFDMTDLPGITFQLDWIRLVADGQTVAETQVQWTDAGDGPYAVSAIAPNGQSYLLGEGFAGTQATVDLSALPPNSYVIRVYGQFSSADSPGNVRVNAAPILNFNEPDVRGDVANRFSIAELGNPWGPIEAADVASTTQLVGISYSGGSLSATSTGDDSTILMNATVPIDTALYRMLTYQFEVSGERDIGTGSVARVLWGNNLSTLTTSDDIIVQEGTNVYEIGDMRLLETETEGANRWFGTVDFFRFDPHEFPTQKTVRLDSIILAPLDTADPVFNIEWEASDPEDNASIRLFVDNDTVRENMPPPTLIFDNLRENTDTSALWNGPQDVPSGEYFVLAEVSDAFNTTYRYSTGPVRVGAAPVTSITITEPDGNADVIAPIGDFARDVLGNAWLMDSPEDVILSRSRGLTGESISGGVYRATTDTNDPSFILLFPGDNTADGAETPIASSVYRRLLAKVRYQSADPQQFSVNFFRDASLTDGVFGTTQGVAVFPGQWQVVEVDLAARSVPALANWLDEPNWQSLRIDPTSQPGVMIEIDWIVLVEDSGPENTYEVRWLASELGDVTQGVNVVDEAGDVIPLVDGLPGSARAYTADLGFLPEGSYLPQVFADPGPTATASNPVVLGEDVPFDRIFIDGFE
ncbi:MAG: hypothetical protein AAGI67_00130 [Pseudomonadota bacterium]